MTDIVSRLGWSAAALAVLTSPIALVLGIPAVVGEGLAEADLQTVRLAALSVWAPLGMLALLPLLRRVAEPLSQGGRSEAPSDRIESDAILAPATMV